MTLEALKDAITHLPEVGRRKLAGWFESMEEAAWDEDLKRDFTPGGKGEQLAKEIQREISEGRAEPWIEVSISTPKRSPSCSSPIPKRLSRRGLNSASLEIPAEFSGRQ